VFSFQACRGIDNLHAVIFEPPPGCRHPEGTGCGEAPHCALTLMVFMISEPLISSEVMLPLLWDSDPDQGGCYRRAVRHRICIQRLRFFPDTLIDAVLLCFDQGKGPRLVFPFEIGIARTGQAAHLR
jgi:hypothetical protein